MMRRYLQTLGRALYARTRPQFKASGPSAPPADQDVVPSPLPTPPQEPKSQLCESMSDLIKWNSIRLVLQNMGPAMDARKSRRKAIDTPVLDPVLDLNVVLSPPQSRPLSDAAASKELEVKTEDERSVTVDRKIPINGSTFDQLFTTTNRNTFKPNNRVTVVGASDVGMATVFSLLAKGVTNDINIIDFSEDKLKGELMDLQSGSKFLQHARLRASKDFSITSGSKICILTPCSETASGDKTYDCVRCNAEVLKMVIPQILRYSPDCVLLVALDPVDVLSYLAWRVSGVHKGRVIGSGTNLSTATFRYLLADRLGLAPSACNGYIIGENGESSVPVWSGVTAGGVLLKELNPDIGTDMDPENWQEIHRQVVQSTQEIRDLKGYNSWAAALSITDICSAVLNDANCVRPLSTYVKGEHNIDEEVFMSLPCVLGGEGVTDIIRQPLNTNEMELLRKSAEAVAENLGTIKITQ